MVLLLLTSLCASFHTQIPTGLLHFSHNPTCGNAQFLANFATAVRSPHPYRFPNLRIHEHARRMPPPPPPFPSGPQTCAHTSMHAACPPGGGGGGGAGGRGLPIPLC